MSDLRPPTVGRLSDPVAVEFYAFECATYRSSSSPHPRPSYTRDDFDLDVAEKPASTETQTLRGSVFRFRQTVRSYEVGPHAGARARAVLQWLEHAVFRAGARARAGWPRERMDAAGFLTFVVGHHLVLGEPAQEGDELVVTSRLVDLRRVSGTWDHEVRQPDGTLVGADRARGAYLDLDGRIRQAPAALLDDLLRGEPQA